MLAYRMKIDSPLEAKATVGAVVYPIKGHDYGLASDDTWATGIPHISVTLDRAGGYPSFTVAERDVEQFEAEDFQPLDDGHVLDVCRPGSGALCCRYLTMGPGWECAKLTSMRMALDLRVEAGSMVAVADNCEGRIAFVKAVA